MNICIYGAASTDIDKGYMEIVEQLGETLAKRGHTLIFGAGNGGLMGAAARGFKKGGGRVAGVAPTFFRDTVIEELYPHCDNIIYTDSMGMRKSVMEMNADAFIVTPGGIGTFDEFFQVLTLKQLHQINKPIAIFNIRGYYYSIEALMHNGAEEKFLRADCLSLYKSFTENEVDALITYVETPCPPLPEEVELVYGFYGDTNTNE